MPLNLITLGSFKFMFRAALSIAIFASIFLTVSTSSAEPATNGTLVYGSGLRYKTVVYKPKLLAMLGAKTGKSYLVFSGLGCDECDINRSIYIYSPADPRMESGELGSRYSYPGKYYHYMSQALVETVRMFVGHCIAPDAESVVWFMNSKLEQGNWKQSVYVARLEGETVAEGYSENMSLSKATVERAVKRRVCREVAGTRFSTEL